jgi:tetratricopeptide (TPR) repeat protein
MKEPLDTLLARGDYAGAAALAAEAGDLARAIQLYERVWRFAEAVPLAVALGDRPLAVRLALDARDVPRALAIAETIPGQDAGLGRAAATLSARGHHEAAAELHARGARWSDAAESFRRAGALLAAGAMHERAGQWQEAGRLYEQVAASSTAGEAAASERASAQLALGRLLGHLGRPLEAARALQAAARHPASRLAARRRLCGELLALGLSHAAEEIARRLNAETPDLPADATAIALLERAEAGATSAPALPRRFQVLHTLGANALGRVFAAQDQLLGRTVALKALSVGPGALGPEREAFLRFLREAEAIGRLRHPNIVALHEVDEHAGLMVLEHLPGGSLADALAERGPLAPASARRLALDLLGALAAAHRAGVVHRDVTPANVFFDAAGNAKLGDFGAAHLTDFGHTQTGSFVGTLAYLSPEQITGSTLGFAADLYGLGATLYHALTGRPPFLGPDVVGQHLAEAPLPPGRLRADLQPAHDLVILQALAKAPADRFPSAEAMAEAVEGWPAVNPVAPPLAPGAVPAADALREGTSSTAMVVHPDQPLGRSARGELVLAFDARVGRRVVHERLDQPLEDGARAELRRLAAAGGPHVQRILALAADSVTYESIEGSPRPRRPDELPEVDLPGPVVDTAGGPVVLLISASG